MAETERKDGQRSRQRSSSSDSSTSDESERSVSPQNRNYSDTNRRDEERSRNGRYIDRSEDARYEDERSGNGRSRDTRYEEREWSPREREYSENSRYDEGRPGNRRYNDRSGETRYDERERSWSPRNRDYSEDSRYNEERFENRRYNDRSRDTSREKDRDREQHRKENDRDRDKDSDRRRHGRSPSPVRKGVERSAPRDSTTMNEPSSRNQENLAPESEPPAKKKKEALDPILTRTGGAYIPPAKLRMMQEQITDKSSLAYQRMSWEALKKSINGLINKVNVSNIGNIIQELLQENIVRGRGQLSRSVLQAQSASPIFTHVYSAVVAIINSKFPQIGELILKRLILNFRKGYRRNDKVLCLTASKFVAHLINQNVAHEVLALEMLTLLLERPTDDSVEVSIGFLKESGLKLTQVSPRGVNAIFERLRNILHESEIDKRVQYMIEVMFAVRKDGFKDHPVIPEGLDLVEEEDQFTHMLPLEDEYNPEDVLNVFKMDPQFLENEEKYKTIKKEILDEGDSDSDDDDGEGGSSDEDSDEEGAAENDDGQKVTIYDQTEINLVAFRRTIYLAIQSSLDFEECAHKLIKMEFPDSQTKELCNMILDCCAQQRTYEKFFGLLAGRFCMLKKEYMEAFEGIFKEQYETIHRLETNKLRNVAKMFAHLLYTDSIPWSVLECIILSEETTTSSSRIFVKIFFQELCEYMGLPRLNARLKDETLQPFFEGLLPRDSPRNTRFAINFFTSIGLGGLTDELREHLKNAPKMIMTQKQDVDSSDSSSSSSSSDSDNSSDSDDSSDESSSSSSESDASSSSDSDASRGKRKAQKKKKSKPTKETNKRHTSDCENERSQKRASEMQSERHHKRAPEMESERHHKRATEMETERHHKRAPEMESERHHKRATEMETERYHKRAPEMESERHHKRATEMETERHHKRATEMETERHHKRATEMENERYWERAMEREPERSRERAMERETERTHKRPSEKENERQRSNDDRRSAKSDGHSHYSLHHKNSHRSPLLSH